MKTYSSVIHLSDQMRRVDASIRPTSTADLTVDKVLLMDRVSRGKQKLDTQGLIIGLGYKYRSGKDEAALFLTEQYGFKRLAFANTLKEVCRVAFGFTDEQLYGDQKGVIDPFWDRRLRFELAERTGKDERITPGYILQLVGTEAFRDTISTEMWVHALARQISADPTSNYVIADTRFPNEGDFVKSRGGIVVRVDRQDRDLAGRNPNHPSEIAMDSYTKWDYILDNNGSFADLYLGVRTILEDIGVVDKFDGVELSDPDGNFIRLGDGGISITGSVKFESGTISGHTNLLDPEELG